MLSPSPSLSLMDRMHLNWSTTLGNVIFSWWTVETGLGFITTLLSLSVITILGQAIRSWLAFREASTSMILLPSFDSPVRSGLAGQMMKPRDFFNSFLVGIQTFIAFMLMLAAMTFNGYVILSIVLGQSIGYYIFGGPVHSH